MNEDPRRTSEEPQVDPEAAARTRRRSLLIIIGVVALVAAVVVALAVVPSADPEVDKAGLRPFDAARSEAEKKTIDLGSGEYEVEVLVQVPEKVCWNGYVGEQAIEGCETTLYDVTGAKNPLGLNATKIDALKTALRVVVLFEGDVIQQETTKKPNGGVALTVAF